MNETMSLLLATAILAAGGIGLFMLKSNDDGTYDDEELELELEELDGLDDLDDLDDYEEDYKPRSRSSNKNKSKRNTKQTGGSRRRY